MKIKSILSFTQLKTLYLIIFILVCATGYSQQKDKQTKTAAKKAVDRWDYLNTASRIAQGLYTHSLCWVYLPAEQDSKQELRNLLFLETPKFKEQKEALGNGIMNSSIDSITIYIDHLAALSTENIKNLLTFEDYYDSTGNRSIKYANAELNLSANIIPDYHKLMTLINYSVQAERNIINQFLASTPGNNSKFNPEEVEERFQSLTEKIALRDLSWRLFAESVNLANRGYDSITRKGLLADTRVNPKFKPADETEEQVSEEIIQSFESLRNAVLAITESLETKADFDDPTTVFLAQEQIESVLLPEVLLRMEPAMNKSIANAFYQLKMSISEDSDRKNSDIRTMLKYNNATLQLIGSEAARSNPQFDIDDLLDEMVPAYAKRFTHEEIKEIIKFQNSRVGKKLQKNNTSIMIEIMQITKDYLEKISQEKNKL